MEVTALCIRLLMDALMLLVAHVQHSYHQTPLSDAAFRIVPNKLQFYEYESVRFTCEGFDASAGCKVRNMKEYISKCSNGPETSTVTCSIRYAFESDSGAYWCEAGGERSSTVNIAVTGGSVILQSPVLPVTAGESVTLSCRNKTTSSNLVAHFYKDGVLMGSSSTGNMTIESVYKSHDGLYKCSITRAGESPESRLAVRGGDVMLESPALPVTEREAVTLRCRKKGTPFDIKADFYKDGVLVRSSSTGEMTIHSVSKSDEGLYRCSISGAGESPESRLTVREEKDDASENQSEDSNTQRTDRTGSDREMIFSRRYYILLLTVVVTVVLFLLLLVLGLLCRKKQLILLEAKMNDPNRDVYAVVRKDKKEDAAGAADNLSLGLDTNQSTKPQRETDDDEPPCFHSTFIDDDASQALQNEAGASSVHRDSSSDGPLTDQDPQYSSIHKIIKEKTPY